MWWFGRFLNPVRRAHFSSSGIILLRKHFSTDYEHPSFAKIKNKKMPKYKLLALQEDEFVVNILPKIQRP